jgi:hypothetical protein
VPTVSEAPLPPTPGRAADAQRSSWNFNQNDNGSRICQFTCVAICVTVS